MTVTKRQICWSIVFLAFAMACWAAFWLSPTCDVPGRRLVMKQSGAAGCFEFWFSRYQTAVGGALALLGAFIAGRYAIEAAKISAEPGQKQLALAQIQTAVGALPVLLDMKSKLTAELALQQEINTILIAGREIYDAMRLGDDGLALSRAPVDELAFKSRQISEQIGRTSSELPISSEIDKSRSDLSWFCLSVGKLAEEYSQFLGRLREGHVGQPLGRKFVADTAPRFKGHIDTLYNALMQADGSVRQFSQNIDANIAATQALIRKGL